MIIETLTSNFPNNLDLGWFEISRSFITFIQGHLNIISEKNHDRRKKPHWLGLLTKQKSPVEDSNPLLLDVTCQANEFTLALSAINKLRSKSQCFCLWWWYCMIVRCIWCVGGSCVQHVYQWFDFMPALRPNDIYYQLHELETVG